jgi:hypothetical protein
MSNWNNTSNAQPTTASGWDKSQSVDSLAPSGWANKKTAAPEQTASGWGKGTEETNNSETKNYTAYVSKDTKALVENVPELSSACDLLLNKANEIAAVMQFKNTLPVAKDREGNWITPSVKAVIEPAMSYDKETRSNVQLTHKDGTPAYALEVVIPNGNETLKFFANDNISDGIKLKGATVEKWSKCEDNRRRCKYYGSNAIAESEDLSDRIKGIFNEIVKADLMTKDMSDKGTELFKLYSDYIKMLNDTTQKIPNENGILVNNAYIQYKDNEFGESLELRSHQDSIVVKLAITSKGDRIALAYNFDSILPDGKYQSTYINNTSDIALYISNKEMGAVIANFKGFDRERSKIEDFCIHCNNELKATTEKVMNKEGNLVNNAYAQYVNDEKYGERVELKTHTSDNIIVRLYSDKSGNKIAKATNFSVRENGKPATVVIKDKATLDAYIDNAEIKPLIAEYVGFSLENSEQRRSNHNVER